MKVCKGHIGTSQQTVPGGFCVLKSVVFIKRWWLEDHWDRNWGSAHKTVSAAACGATLIPRVLSFLSPAGGRGRKVQPKPERETPAKLGSGDLAIDMGRKLLAPICVNDLRPAAQTSSM